MKVISYRFLQTLLFLGLTVTVYGQKMRTTKWESGLMDRRTKVGIWEYYGATGSNEKVLVQRYDHTGKRLLYYRPINEIAYNTEVSPGQWTRRTVDQPPLYIGGNEALAVYISQLQYPEDAQESNIQGAVIIGFTIDTLGMASKHKVVRGIGSSCDQEAMRVVRTIPHEWIPARIGSRAVPVEYELTLVFRMARP